MKMASGLDRSQLTTRTSERRAAWAVLRYVARGDHGGVRPECLALTGRIAVSEDFSRCRSP